VRNEQIIGDKRPRDARGCDDDLAQAAASDEPMTSPDNAAHTVLFPRGSGGFVQRQNACSRHHYVQKKLGSVAYVYGRAQEFVWYHFQMIVKRSLHQSAPRVVNATIAMNADAETVTEHTQRLREQWEQLKRAAPEYVPYCSSKETYTGTVGKQVVGSKAYWSEARAELIAMSMEFDTPTHWATFTCNETGWSDLKAACGGEHHSQRPVEATRQYNHRWQLFLKTYLKGDTPIGKIERVWWRQEDQARGSLHVHVCIWVDRQTIKEEGIVATAPRDCHTTAEREWRQFVRHVQRHDCRPKCTRDADGATESCKYGYPRRLWSNDELAVAGPAAYAKVDPQTNRYEYRTVRKEDQRLSPYVAEWLLAWGASMNIQRCTGAAFMHYTAKYVAKPEKPGFIQNNVSERERHALQRTQIHFLNGRVVGMPEAVQRTWGFNMSAGMGVTHHCVCVISNTHERHGDTHPHRMTRH
jgi:hypothetical protein